MISFGDFLVVIVAVSIVLGFVLMARHYIRRAQQTERAED